MSSPLKTIESLIPFLPKKDVKYAKEFLQNRDFESLKELTWSALQMVELAYRENPVPDKYKYVDIDKVRDLAIECSEYYYLLYPEELEETDEYNDLEEPDLL